jgi:hypothetical protein
MAGLIHKLSLKMKKYIIYLLLIPLTLYNKIKLIYDLKILKQIEWLTFILYSKLYSFYTQLLEKSRCT